MERKFQKALAAHRAGRLAEAERTYTEVLSAEPRHAAALHLLGLIRFQNGDVEAASELIGRAVAVEPDFVEAHNNLGIALKRQGKLEAAVAAYRRALALKPDYAEAHNNLGNALKEQGEVENAVAALRRALELKPDYAEAHYNLGNALKDQGQLGAAVTAYRAALELKPDYAEAHNNLGNALREQGQLEAAVAAFREALELRSDYAETHNNLGNALKDQGRLEAAAEAYRAALKRNPAFPEAHHNLATVLMNQDKLDEAAAAFGQALAFKPDYPEAYYNLGRVLDRQGKPEEAVSAYRKASALDPVFAEAHYNRGIALKNQGKIEDAVAAYREALKLKPDFAEAQNNLGNALIEQGELDDAVVAYHAALKIDPDYAEAHNNLGNALQRKGGLDEAVAHYRKALEVKPDHAEAHNNLAIALKDMGDLEAAVAAFRKALALKPDYAQARNNLGNALKEQGKLKEAVAAYREALALDADYAEAHHNLAIVLIDQGELHGAADALRSAIALDPDYATAYATLVHVLRHMCDWRGLEAIRRKLDELVDAALAEGVRPGEMPFISITIRDDAARNLDIARAWAADTERRMSALKERSSFEFSRHPGAKIRIGYLSADFHSHATAHLMLALFGLHDREAFEIHAYSYGPDDRSDYRKRIERDCDAFVDIRKATHLEAARQIHDDGIDILVDLKGYTRGARLEICALRPAPVQVTYLGFPGSTGAEFFDYVITDRIVTPEDHGRFFSETFVYLPDCYQVNDHRQPIADVALTRAEFGLPDEGTVFCCFNQTYKIEPVMFEVWMRLLRELPGSVLWLWRSHQGADRNLKREARARDVDPGRIVFADKLPKPEHLARLKLADLYLDTRICNGHTTTSDALWAGLPVVALEGRHFASRVASSLLTAVGLPELISRDLDEYEALALRLARHPDQLRAIREKLGRNRLRTPLFDTPRFVRHLEDAYRRIWERYLAGEAPRTIEVAARRAAGRRPQTTKRPGPTAKGYQAAIAAHRAGRLDEVARLCDEVLAAEPRHAGALHLLGLVRFREGDAQAASELMARAVAVEPGFAEAHGNLGIALRRQGKLEAAITEYRAALALKPDYAAAHNNLGNALREQGELESAVVAFRKALDLKPDYAEAHYNLGNALKDRGELEAAVSAYREALELKPAHTEAYNNLGNALKELGQLEAAVAAFRKALELKPDFAATHSNLGNALKDQDKLEEAEVAYRKAIELDPGIAQAHYNLGIALMDQGKPGAALDEYQQAISIEPDNPEIHFNLALAALSIGDYARGWAEYEWRWRTRDFNGRRPGGGRREWDGSPLEGENILLYAEQGIGDHVMFAGLVPEVAATSGRCVLECDDRLVPLFRRSFAGVDVIPLADPRHPATLATDIKLQCALGSLPRHLRSGPESFPERTGYLVADGARTRACRRRYEALGGGIKVGLSWRSGNPKTGDVRTLGLGRWTTVLQSSDCLFVNLQYGKVEDELAGVKDETGIDIFVDPEIDPWSDLDGLAAQISALDLVISIDNSTVHMAGALGKPVWGLLPFVPDWRWLREREDSPWYPSIRLFRQKKLGAWDDLIEKVADALRELGDGPVPESA